MAAAGWQTNAMQLQKGVTADQAIRALDQLVVDLENLRAMGGVPVDIAPDRYLGGRPGCAN